MNGDALRLITRVWQPLGIRELFNGDPNSAVDHSAYVDYYVKQWQLMMAGYNSSQCPTTSTSVDEMLGLIQQIHAGRTQVEVVAQLQEKGGDYTLAHPVAENSINLALRLVSMMKFGTARRQIMPRRCLAWEHGSLKEYLASYFGKQPALSCDRVRLPKSFQAWSIERIGGIDICFTDNLADHLLLVEDDSKLLIFHHVSFLEYQQDINSVIFPDGLVSETLRTVALLLPEAQFGRRARGPGGKWLRQKRQKEVGDCVLDARLAHCGNLQTEERQIEHFTYWRDRLAILKQAYDDATPRTLSQWWHDRRNGVQWYTFWVAILVLILTAFLGLVQCVESALQVYKAYFPS
ncbi:hypothetical protein PG993_008394 [Apiospora rasikravindrae]|uniref:Uncharacterized protein n=1 Tax=Apiospora rasikravindrae TaxID=990691 RepID=A0ABR1T078_9PEZI